MEPKIYRCKDVVSQTGLSRSTIYRLMSIGLFPISVRMGPKVVGWMVKDIEKWIDDRSNFPE